jgi:hypothetical protein
MAMATCLNPCIPGEYAELAREKATAFSAPFPLQLACSARCTLEMERRRIIGSFKAFGSQLRDVDKLALWFNLLSNANEFANRLSNLLSQSF